MVSQEANACLKRAEAALARRELSAALAGFDHAETLGGDIGRCCGGQWKAAMLAGDFALAWRQSDALRQYEVPDPHRFWNGEPLVGRRVIVRCLHGFGDAVQMLRYAPMLAAVAASVVYEVAPRFVELARMFDGVEHVITWGEAAPAQPPVWDVQLEVMELPYMFRTVLADLPLATGYLRLPELHRPSCSRMRVGVAWTAGEWDPERELPLEQLRLLLEEQSCEFWSLRHGGVPGELAGRLEDDSAAGENLVALAGLIARMDLVITVDTLAAHLAGALGKPAWVLLQKEADWRWMEGREDSPWYPSLRLIRQPVQGDWGTVIATVRVELGRLAARFQTGDL